MALVAVAVLVVAACGGDDEAADTTLEPSTTAAATTTTESVPSSTTSPTTAAPGTTTAPATTAPPTTTPSCEPVGDTSDKQSGFPGTMTSLIGKEIRTGAHECYERIVIELQPSDHPIPAIVPGYWVRYQDDPIDVGESGGEFVDLKGDANLLITVEAWMTTMEGTGYLGPTDITPTNVTTIEQLYLTHNFEGVHTWAVGLDQERPFRVFTLTDPVRIVVDVQL